MFCYLEFSALAEAMPGKIRGADRRLPEGEVDWFLLACCPKCQGDLVLDEGDWRCMQCGTYYYPTRHANGRRLGRPPTPDSRPALPPASSAGCPALPPNPFVIPAAGRPGVGASH